MGFGNFGHRGGGSAGGGPTLKAATTSFLSSVAPGAVISALVDPYGSGSTFSTVGAVPAQIALSGGNIVAGASAAVAGNSYTVTIRAAKGGRAVEEPISLLCAVGGPSAVVTWLTQPNNRTPSFQIDAAGWQATDVVEFELDTSTDFSSGVSTNIGALIGLPSTITADTLPDGTYYARARIVRGVTAFPWSSPITINIAYQGPAPIAGAISAPVAYNTPTPINVASSISGGPHSSVAVQTQPAHGTVSVAGDVITYTPNSGYSGVDSFTYTATGVGGTSNAATVSITVAALVRIDSSTTYFTSSTVRIDG